MVKLVGVAEVEAFGRDGCVLLPGLLKDWVEVIAAGIERNVREPGPLASEGVERGEPGRFFDDYCNWRRIPEFEDVVRNSPMAEAAAVLMGSSLAQLFHEHVLVKEPGTAKETPWHQDAPYYFVDGRQTVSFWVPVDPVTETTLRFVAGSHLWPKLVLPVRWLTETSFYAGEHDFVAVPEPEAPGSGMRVLEWPMAPGDAVAFTFRTVHGARGNPTAGRRRAFSARWVGEDAAVVARAGPTSPPFPGHGMKPGDRLRQDRFPVIWRRAS
jgi:ectoine hydroxylase-related dioxygenase (phytanoyl-CoA dioxygenase family)